jgi:hypothetical protein
LEEVAAEEAIAGREHRIIFSVAVGEEVVV